MPPFTRETLQALRRSEATPTRASTRTVRHPARTRAAGEAGLSADLSAVFVVEEDLNGCCKTRPAGFAASDIVHDYSYFAGPRVNHRVIWFTETARALE